MREPSFYLFFFSIVDETFIIRIEPLLIMCSGGGVVSSKQKPSSTLVINFNLELLFLRYSWSAIAPKKGQTLLCDLRERKPIVDFFIKKKCLCKNFQPQCDGNFIKISFFFAVWSTAQIKCYPLL